MSEETPTPPEETLGGPLPEGHEDLGPPRGTEQESDFTPEGTEPPAPVLGDGVEEPGTSAPEEGQEAPTETEPGAEPPEHPADACRAPDEIQEPDYAALRDAVQDSIAAYAKSFEPTDARRRAKVEARALKVILPALHKRLEHL
jgi:hypothetical protein